MGEGPSASTFLEALAQLPGNGHENDQADEADWVKNSVSSILQK
jgi:hypothetical protein